MLEVPCKEEADGGHSVCIGGAARTTITSSPAAFCRRGRTLGCIAERAEHPRRKILKKLVVSRSSIPSAVHYESDSCKHLCCYPGVGHAVFHLEAGSAIAERLGSSGEGDG